MYAGFWKRFAAYLIDALIIGTVAGILFSIIVAVTRSAGGIFFAYVIELAVVWLYFALQESSSRQATVGKRALGIYVVDINGNRISFGRATGRYFGKILSGMMFCIGYIIAGFTAQKQALHDFLASTLVLDGRANGNVNQAFTQNQGPNAWGQQPNPNQGYGGFGGQQSFNQGNPGGTFGAQSQFGQGQNQSPWGETVSADPNRPNGQ